MITRDHNGIVSVDGEEVAKVPSDQLMLSTLAGGFLKGADYTIDPDWVYVNGRKAYKQFLHVRGFYNGKTVRVWDPNIRDLAKLEARYWKVLVRSQNFLNNVYSPAFNELLEVGEAHCKINHRHNGDKHWWLYNVDKKRSSIGFDWVDEPVSPKNLEIGQKYYHLDRCGMAHMNRVYIFNVALQERFIKELDKQSGSKFGYFTKPCNFNSNQVRFVVNGRDYWFVIDKGEWKILSWSTDVPPMVSTYG